MSQFKPGNSSQALATKRPITRPKPASLSPADPVIEATEAQPAADEPSTGVEKAALVFTLLFVFFRFSFLHELIGARLGVDTHLVLILGGLAVITALITGGLIRSMSHPILLVWAAFSGCMVFASVFSSWRGGSFAILFPFLRTTLILVLLIPAVTTSKKSLVQVMQTIGVAGLALILMGLTANDFRTGRLELTGAGDSVSNSNDYAANLILLMPAIAYLCMRQGTKLFMKLIGCASLGVCCFLVLSTGSRGALISIGLSMIYLLKVGSGKVRIAILVGLPAAALIAIPFLPGEAAARLTSLFSDKSNTSEAMESQAQRTALLMESIKFTFQHPLLGVGPGTFADYQAMDAAANGERGMWHETHNSYTQVSSECGIPAILFYFCALGMTFGVFRRGRKSADPDIRAASSVLSLMLVSYMICMFFLAQGYGFGFPVMGGIAISIDRLLKRERPFAQMSGS
jgi:O-antigen ligase